MLNRLCLGAAVAAGLAASASAAVVYDFEDGVNPFVATGGSGYATGSGAIATDQAYGGNNSVFFGAGHSGYFMIPSSEVGPAGVVVKMQIFDQGKYINRAVTGFPGNSYGPRWGIATGADAAEGNVAGASLGASIVERTFTGGFYSSQNGYVTGSGASRTTSSWFTITHVSGSSRQVTTYGDGGSNPTGTAWVPPTAGEGKWTEWTFTITPTGTGTFNVAHQYPGIAAANATISGPATQVWLNGARAWGDNHLNGVWVDNITISAVPEPAMLSLAGLAGFALLRRRSA